MNRRVMRSPQALAAVPAARSAGPSARPAAVSEPAPELEARLERAVRLGHRPGRFSFGAPLLRRNAVQRSEIRLNDEVLTGSVEENADQFWHAFDEKYQEDFAVALSRLIRELKTRWYAHEATDWDRGILRRASERLQQAAGYAPTPKLGQDAAANIKGVLLGQPEQDEVIDQEIAPEDIQAPALGNIGEALTTYAGKEVKESRRSDAPQVPLGAESQQGKILQRAVQIILSKHGIKMALAATFNGADETPLQNLKDTRLHHATERWETAGLDERQNAGRLAMLWVMSSIEEVSQVVEDMRSDYHPNSSPATVRTAYAQAVLNAPVYNQMVSDLAEIRLRWGPITYGSDIYLKAASPKLKLNEQWDLLQDLIHEALHSAEHPKFTEFLDTAIPESLRSDIREGIVEHMTLAIWTDVLDTVQTGQVGFAVHDLAKPLTATQNNIAKLRNKQSLYPEQTKLITTILNLLDHGEQRLEAAYIYGNVEAFLPRLVEPEAASEDELDEL